MDEIFGMALGVHREVIWLGGWQRIQLHELSGATI
jgi:hypothetical protein